MKIYNKSKFLRVISGFFLLLACGSAAAQNSATVQVGALDIHSGYIAHRIDLQAYAKPDVTISEISFAPVDKIPEDAFPSSQQQFDILLGKDRKKPFAIVRIPAYSLDENGALQQVTKLKLTFKETTPPAEVVNTGRSAAKNTAGTNSPLASGTWPLATEGAT